MGVSLTAYEDATATAELHKVRDDGVPQGWCEDEDCVMAFAYAAFHQSLAGLEAGRCYAVKNPTRMADFNYAGYGRWRADLSRTILGVEPEVVWANVEQYRDEPFFELIHFADNEGTIGPVAAARLAEDFAAHRERYTEAHADDEEGMPEGWSVQKYDALAHGFAVAARGGLVEFR